MVGFTLDFGNVLQDIISSLVVTLITATIGYIFINKYISKLNFSNKMQSYGFVNTSTNKQSKKEIKKMCQNAVEIKIINVSGFHYLNENENLLKQALERNVKIRFLAASPNGVFLKNIENMEYNTKIAEKRMREKESKIGNEIWNLIDKYKDHGLDIRFYSTEYRLPYILAYYEDGSIDAWLTMTLPPYKSTKSFVLRGRKDSQKVYNDDVNFIDMMESNFDTIWDYNSMGIDETERKNG